jgi:GNAT superfamily N-acetyltransferase
LLPAALFGACFACPSIELSMTSAPEAVFRPTEVRTRHGRTLLVKEYSAGDFGALVEMYKSFLPKRVAQGLPPTDIPRIAHWLDGLQRISSALLAWDEKKVAAHAALCPIRSDCVEFSIFVHQDYRKQGLGTALGERALDWARPMGFRSVYLTTEISNVPAIRLFHKLGFQTISSAANECEMKLELVERRAA